MRATVDSELCTGCGLCPDTCPDVFEIKDVIKTFPGPPSAPSRNKSQTTV